MKPLAPGAGSVSYRRLSAVAAAGLLGLFSGCVASGPGAPATAAAPATGALAPQRLITGARLIVRADATGLPVLKDGFGAMVQFVFPVAVAATPFDVYVADAGAGRLYRYDAAVDAMAVVSGAVVTPQTRLSTTSDGSVYVVNPGGSAVRRFARSGRLLQEIDPSIGAARYDDVAVDQGSNRVYALDRLSRRLEEIQPLGRAAVLIDPSLLPEMPVAVAWDGQRLYVAGNDCSCVVAFAPHGERRMVIADGLRRPVAMVAQDGWLVVADAAERKLALYREGRLRSEVPYEALHLVEPQGLSLSQGLLYVADPAGRKVAVFRLRP